MSHHLVVINGKKVLKWLIIVVGLAAVIYLVWSLFFSASSTSGSEQEVKIFDIAVVEYTAKHPETGKEMEMYRFNPGFLTVNQGDRVRLNIIGLGGHKHPFIIEGLSISGEVTSGQVTTVEFVASKKGTFKIICLNHTDWESNGPMVGYLMVQ